MRAYDFKRIRRRLFKTQKEAATALGVSQVTISRWENGDPIPKTAELLLRELDVKMKA